MTRGRSRVLGIGGRLLACAAAAALASACGPPSANYVKDPSGTLLLKLPAQWAVFDQTQLYRDQNPNASFQTAKAATAGQWTIGFDGARRPTIRELLSSAAPDPTGFVRVRPVTTSEQASLATFAGLRNIVFSLDKDQAQSPDLVRLGSSRVLHFAGGFRALRVTFSIRTSIGRPFTTFTQIAAVDAGVQHLYLLVIGCGEDCYRANLDSINHVLNSWTLKES